MAGQKSVFLPIDSEPLPDENAIEVRLGGWRPPSRIIRRRERRRVSAHVEEGAIDPLRFENLVRSLAAASNRRTVMRTVGGAALIGLFDRWATKGVAAKKKGKSKKSKKKGCKSGAKKCGNKCIPKTACCADKECNRCTREICLNGACGCHPDFIRQNGVCSRFPNCWSSGILVDDPDDCCSEEAFFDEANGRFRCLPGKFECLVDLDCVSGSCKGWMCPELYHAASGC
jgi:hypothetical protein